MEDRQQRQDLDEFLPESFSAEDLEPRAFRPPPRRRVLWTLGVLVVLALLALLPPLVQVNSLQKRIAASISLSLGRPVHAGDVTLNLLPFPGFTIQNFVVSEDPSFGSEPVIRASSVMARLRWRSLWNRRVEFSRITLADASVNLVRRVDGQWNLESILLQASRMPAAPTGQKGAGDRPRFPYIEATGARVNVKLGLEKMPVSLTDADFALWLPQAEQWRLRLEAHPARTDASVTDTGVVRLEGTLGRAARLAEVPIDLHASWTAAPLGAASSVVTGQDMGFRGEMTLNATLKGKIGDHAFETRLQMDRVRRADFVPARLMEVDLACTARALGNLHRLEDLHCAWPADSKASGLIVTGEIPDTLVPSSARLQASLTQTPASGLLDLLRLATPRIAPDLRLDGTVSLQLACCEGPHGITSGEFAVGKAVLSRSGGEPFVSSDVTGSWDGEQLTVPAIPLDLGGVKPAQLEGRLNWHGYTLHLTGPAQRGRLQELAAALPPFGDGLQEFYDGTTDTQALSLDMVSSRNWGGPQQWQVEQSIPSAPSSRRHRR